MSKKEFLTRVDCKDAEIGDRVNDGWVIHFMQFMADGKLNVVFVREVAVAAAPTPVVIVEPVKVESIVSKPLPVGVMVMGLDEPPRSVPYSFNTPMKPKPGDTRKVHVPDGVMGEAMARGREVYERTVAEGAEAIRRASESFRPNFSKGAAQ